MLQTLEHLTCYAECRGRVKGKLTTSFLRGYRSNDKASNHLRSLNILPCADFERKRGLKMFQVSRVNLVGENFGLFQARS